MNGLPFTRSQLNSWFDLVKVWLMNAGEPIRNQTGYDSSQPCTADRSARHLLGEPCLPDLPWVPKLFALAISEVGS